VFEALGEGPLHLAEAVELAFVDFDIVAEKDPAAKETFEAMRVIWAEGIVSLRE
jgi:hypothetical protein